MRFPFVSDITAVPLKFITFEETTFGLPLLKSSPAENPKYQMLAWF
jgi:hypothetical protein